MKVDFSQESTKRGAVWLCGGLISLVFLWYGKDASMVMTITASLAGGLGLLRSD